METASRIPLRSTLSNTYKNLHEALKLLIDGLYVNQLMNQQFGRGPVSDPTHPRTRVQLAHNRALEVSGLFMAELSAVLTVTGSSISLGGDREVYVPDLSLHGEGIQYWPALSQ